MNQIFAEVVDYLGGQQKAATALGVSQGAISQMVTGKRPVPVERCAALERATQGKFRCEQLRPDVHWERIKHQNWPWHVLGKPLIDVALGDDAQLPVSGFGALQD